MRKSTFREDQIIAILAEHEHGMKTSEVCREARDQPEHVLQMEG